MRKKIAHITSLHNRYDTRIFHKQLTSLSQHYDCYLIVADGLGDETVNNIKIIDAGKPQSTKDRLTRIRKIILKKALDLNADLYQYHDPELNLIASSLLKSGKKVLYDAHEDAPRQYTSNSKGNKSNFKIKLVAKTLEFIENRAAKKLSGILTATEGIENRYKKLNPNTLTVKNYVITEEFANKKKWEEKENAIAYIGGISKKRGIIELLEVIGNLKIKLKLAGVFQPPSMEKECRTHKAWQYVDYKGNIDRKGISNLLSESKIGMLTLYPTPNHNISLPIKLFEYMAAGIPVIVSNIAIWEKIVNQAHCGMIVDPKNPDEIAKVVSRLLKDDQKAKELGKNGKRVVQEKYNWKNEADKLIQFYHKILTN